MNQIVEVKLTLEDSGMWRIDIRKNFEEKNGGGWQIFSEWTSAGVHHALDIARSMVTVHPGQRTDL